MGIAPTTDSALRDQEGGTCRFGMIRDKNHAKIPRFAEIGYLQERCNEEIDVLLAIATGV